MIHRWLILIDGFTKQKGEPTGFDPIFDDHCCRRGWRVDQYEWDAEWHDEAGWIHRHAAADCTIVIAAYSWGAGYGARELAQELAELGRTVDTMILCDPVYRNPLFPHWWPALPSSLTNGRKIDYSAGNVIEIEWFYQRENKPSGHQPAGAKRISAGVQLPYKHSAMEDAPEFRQAVARVVEACA